MLRASEYVQPMWPLNPENEMKNQGVKYFSFQKICNVIESMLDLFSIKTENYLILINRTDEEEVKNWDRTLLLFSIDHFIWKWQSEVLVSRDYQKFVSFASEGLLILYAQSNEDDN